MKTSSTVIFVAGLVLVASLSYSHASPYDCARIGSECYSPTDICMFDGACNCSLPYMGGYDCSLNTTLVDDRIQCDPPCGNGTCLIDNTCYCEPGMFGDRCEEKRVSLKCYPDRMEFMLKPNVGKGNAFKGLVKVQGDDVYGGSYDVSDCIVMASSGDDDVTLSVSYSDCGGTLNTTADGDGKFSFQLLILFSPPVIRSTDLVFDASCILLQGDKFITFTSQIVRFSKGNEFEKKKTIEKNINPISLTVIDVDTSAALSGPAVIGKRLMLDYKFNGGETYDSFLLYKVFASSGRGETVTLIDKGCTVLENLIVQSLATADTFARAYFSAFKFIGSNMVTFTSEAKLCNKPGQCNQTDCASLQNATEASVRKRREIINDLNNDDVMTYTDLDATIFVTLPSRTTADRTRLGVDGGSILRPQEECTGQSLLLLVLCGLLAALLLLSTGCGLFFFARMHLGRFRSDAASSSKKLFKMAEARDYL